MKRDIEMVRQILCDLEAHESMDKVLQVDDPFTAYQISLMKDAGLIEAVIIPNELGLPRGAALLGLTWAGHDFLDASRDSKIWKMAKEHVLKPGVSWTFSLLLEWLKLHARQSLGLPPTATS